jgi:hypothetical protein
MFVEFQRLVNVILLSSRTAITNYHTLEPLKPTAIYSLPVLGARSSKSRCQHGCTSNRSLRENYSMLLLVFCGYQISWSSFTASVLTSHFNLSLFACVCLLIGYVSLDLGLHGKLRIFRLITKTLFPRKVTIISSRDEDTYAYCLLGLSSASVYTFP